MTILLTQIHSETNVFSVNQSDLRERKERIHNLFIGLKKRDIFMENGNESWDVLGDSRKRYRGPWAEIGKY